MSNLSRTKSVQPMFGGLFLMRQNALCLAAAVVLIASGRVDATWSIVIADADTKEIAVGTVTCLNQFDLLALVPVVVVGKGGAAAQAMLDVDGIRRGTIFDGLMNEADPVEILGTLSSIPGHQNRQYGIVDIIGRKITFTGDETSEWAGGVIGSQCPMFYAIQGNILAGDCVVPAIEQAILTTPGDIPTKLMAGMQAAREQGGDGRCSCSAFDPTGCGCPPPEFIKSGHIGAMIVARIGDTDDRVCNAAGCADGQYFMRLNVAFQNDNDPDPVMQLQAQFDAWRTGLIGVVDAVHSQVRLDPPSIPADGASQTTMNISLLDWQDQPVRGTIQSVVVEHAPDSAGLSSIGEVMDAGGDNYTVTITAGTENGIDRFRVSADDGIRPVTLMPDAVLEYCLPGECLLDCNENDTLDACDIGDGVSGDCNGNVIPDECEIADGSSLDCDTNSVPDECESDCNNNSVVDSCDIAEGTSADNLPVGGDGIPDECQADCNDNQIPDDVDLVSGSSPDCNSNSVPDECDLADGTSADCNTNNIPDECDVVTGTQWASTVIDFSSETSGDAWSAAQALGEPDTFEYGDLITAWSPLSKNGTLEYLTLGYANHVFALGVVVRETWGNGFVYQVDVVDLENVYHTVWAGVDPSQPGAPADFVVSFPQTEFLVKGVKIYVDTDHNLSTWEEIDAVQLLSFPGDCNTNGVPDACDIADGVSEDCNANGVPDECDISTGSSTDCNGNDVPDECDIADGSSDDVNDNGVPDECECIGDIIVNSAVDVTDILAVLAQWGPCPGCGSDLNVDGVVDVIDLLILLAAWGPC